MAPIKPRIIVERRSNHTLYTMLSDYFDLAVYDPTETYDLRDLVLVYPYRSDWWKPLYEQGHKIVIDNLAEPYDRFKTFFPVLNHGQYHVLYNNNWFWYTEAKATSKIDYIPVRTYKKLALMPINFERLHRARLYEAMKPYLDDCIYSFRHHGIHLPNDTTDTSKPWDRYFNPDWYNDTCFTLAPETFCDGVNEYPMDNLWHNNGYYSGPYPFVTEKTMKPIAFKHPFMIYGQSNILAYLHNLGFETYENLFDESYDTVDNSNLYRPDSKLKIIINNVQSFDRRPYDSLTLEKIQHNYAHYSNLELIGQRVKKEIVDPMMEFYVN